MPALNISQLQKLTKKRNRQMVRLLPSFETSERMFHEDVTRAQALAGHRPRTKESKKLERQLSTPFHDPRSPASSRYMGDFRLRASSAVYELLQPYAAATEALKHPVKKMPRLKLQDVRFITLAPRNLILTADQLDRLSAKQISAKLRMDLHRAGAKTATGWAYFGIDVCFCEDTKRFHVHFHGIVTEGMIDVVKSLRKMRKYKPNPDSKRLVYSKKMSFYAYAPVISYCTKSFANARKLVRQKGSGKWVTAKLKTRIDEPWHSRLLLWRHRQKVQHLVVLMNLRVRRDGLTPTRAWIGAEKTS